METKTMIGIKLKVEGVHYFPKADEIAGFEVNYLKSFHRHNFGIECTMEVNHDNRDVEFIMLKHRVEEYLCGKYFDQNYHCLNFKAMSCEMIAKELLTAFGFCYVKVDEDDENYAEVFVTLKDDENKQPTNQTPKSNLKRISFIIGKFCSGKSYYAQKLLEEGKRRGYDKEWGFLEIGDIVRGITKTKERTIDPALDKEIVNEVIELVEGEGCESEELFITGIRQLSVFKKLYEEFVSKGCEIHIHYLPTPRNVRKKFFEAQKKRNPEKNTKSFEDFEKDEQKLGIDQLCSYLIDDFVEDDNFHFINISNI